MTEYNKILEMAKAFEKKADEILAKYPGYPKVKEVLEGKTKKVDVRSMIMDSKAFFSGKNSPVELVKTALDGTDLGMTLATGKAKEFLNEQEKELSDELEKKNAIIENRAATKVHKVKKDDSVFTGRLMSDDGKKPIAGARVLVRVKGDETAKPVLAEVVTDVNGEYMIHLDKDKLKLAGKSVSVGFETRDGEILTKAKDIVINTVKGKAATIDGKVSEDKMDIATEFVSDTEANKRHAYLEMAELKKSEAEIKLFRFKAETANNELKEKINKLKNLFEVK